MESEKTYSDINWRSIKLNMKRLGDIYRNEDISLDVKISIIIFKKIEYPVDTSMSTIYDFLDTNPSVEYIIVFSYQVLFR